jgi:hypothetical protein
MSAFAPWLIAGAAGIFLVLGAIHVLYTFRGSKLAPRDRELISRMQSVSPVISEETTVWKCWVGFNASHGFGVILFGAVYGYLALVHGAFFFQSIFLQLLGLMFLVGYACLGKRYWFSIPSRGILLATTLYTLGLLIGLAHRLRPFARF